MSAKRAGREQRRRTGRADRPADAGASSRRVPAVAALIGLIMATVLLVDAAIVPIEILTPHEGHAPLSPLYAIWWPVLSPWLLPAALIGLLLSLAPRWLPRSPGATVPLLCGVLLVLFATSTAMIRGGPPALTAPFVIYAGEDYSADLPLALAAPGRFLEHFVELMPRLSLHGRTHPPGFTLFLAAVVRLGGSSPVARALVVVLLGALAVVPLYWLTRRRYGETAARWAALLYTAVPAVVLFTATSLDALLPLPALMALDCTDRARTGRAAWAIPAGGLVALLTLLSFSGLALLPIGWAVLLGGTGSAGDRPQDRRRGAATCGLLLIGFLAPVIVLRLAAGFDLVACFAQGRANLAFIEEQLKGRGAHPVRDYLYTAVGNLVAFAIGLGATIVALAGPAIRRQTRIAARRRRADLDGLLLGTTLTLLLMSLSFVYLLEVERIWLFLMGPLVAIAAHEIDARRLDDRTITRLVALLAGQTLLTEVLLYTFW